MASNATQERSPDDGGLSREMMDRALDALDEEVAKSEFLMAIAPLRFMASGGALAVKVFNLRQSTADIDACIDPNVRDAPEFYAELLEAIKKVRVQLDLQDDWFNDEMTLFIRRERREAMLWKAIVQNIIVYQGTNIILYAADLYWCLEQKLRRITHTAKATEELVGRRAKDISDAVAILRRLIVDAGMPLDANHLAGLDSNGLGLPIGKGLQEVRVAYERVYHEIGVASMEWDSEAGCWKYWDHMQERWVQRAV